MRVSRKPDEMHQMRFLLVNTGMNVVFCNHKNGLGKFQGKRKGSKFFYVLGE